MIGVIPLTAEWKRGAGTLNTNLDPEAISAGYLAQLAHDWDKEGRSTPTEFVESLLFETEGTVKKGAVQDILSRLSADI